MTVNIIISDQSGGNSLADSVDLGNVSPSGETTFQDLFIRHDANIAKITDCAFYASKFSSTGYLGEDADSDYDEIIGWADDAWDEDPSDPKGFIINQVPPSSWSGEQFDTSNDISFRTGSGDINGQIILETSAVTIGTPVDAGDIPVDGEAHIQVRIKVPDSVPAGANYRAIQLVMAYSATS